jgi:membrane protein DedA with SNARE-associated domain
MSERLISAVISTRFLPGARLPTYTACGFLGVSFRHFALAVIVGTLVWTTLLYSVSLGLGSIVMTRLGAWRWPVGIVLALVVLGAGRWISRRWAARTGKGEGSR